MKETVAALTDCVRSLQQSITNLSAANAPPKGAKDPAPKPKGAKEPAAKPKGAKEPAPKPKGAKEPASKHQKQSKTDRYNDDDDDSSDDVLSASDSEDEDPDDSDDSDSDDEKAPHTPYGAKLGSILSKKIKDKIKLELSH